MSVLECDRAGCENIMCDNLSHEHGYICRSCMEELADYLQGNYHLGFSTCVKEFMDTEKKDQPKCMDRDLVEQQVRREFKDNLEY